MKLFFLLAGLFVAFTARAADIINVDTNIALQQLSTSAANEVVRLGFTTQGDMPPVVYKAVITACPLNGGNGDNKVQVKSSDGYCWEAVGVQSPTTLVVGQGSLGGNAIIDVEYSGPTTADFNVGWTDSFVRQGFGLTQQTTQEGTFTGCSVTGSTVALVEYDCGWYLAVDYSAGTGSTGTNAVGFRSEGDIAKTQSSGAAWGGIDYAVINSGGTGDGVLIGREVDVFNNGTDVPYPITAGKIKNGLQVIAAGSTPSSAGLFFGGAAQWNYGVFAVTNTFPTGGQFLFLDDGSGTTTPLFSVNAHTGVTSSVGYESRNGTTGTFNGHTFNIYWTGTVPDLYIDNVRIGTITTH